MEGAGARHCHWSLTRAELEAVRLEQISRLVVGDVRARVPPRVELLVARLGVGGHGDETVET